jgi:hypothetical protein
MKWIQIEDYPKVRQGPLAISLFKSQCRPFESRYDVLCVEFESLVEEVTRSEEVSSIPCDSRGYEVSSEEARETLKPILYQRRRLVELTLKSVGFGQWSESPSFRIPCRPVLCTECPDFLVEGLNHSGSLLFLLEAWFRMKNEPEMGIAARRFRQDTELRERVSTEERLK